MQKDHSSQTDANATIVATALSASNSGFAETNTGHGRSMAETSTGHGREVAETNTGHGYSSEVYAYQDNVELNLAEVTPGVESSAAMMASVV